MSAPTPRPFIVNALNVNTAEKFQSRLWAIDTHEAAELSRRKGITILSIIEEPVPVVYLADESKMSLVPLQDDIRYLHREVIALGKARILRSPVFTIGWGIVISVFLWTLIVLAALASVGAIGVFRQIQQQSEESAMQRAREEYGRTHPGPAPQQP